MKNWEEIGTGRCGGVRDKLTGIKTSKMRGPTKEYENRFCRLNVGEYFRIEPELIGIRTDDVID